MVELSRRRFLVAAAAGIGAGALGAVPAGATPSGGVVVDGCARFQVLSPTLIRLEYADDGRFEDRPTMLAYRRDIAAPSFSQEITGPDLVLRTERVTVSYRRGSGPFGPDNLRITVRRGDTDVHATPVWQPTTVTPNPAGSGMAGYLGLAAAEPGTPGNLGGWLRSLDSRTGPVPLHDGLLARSGWTFLDDTRSVLLGPDGATSSPRPGRAGAYQDGYLFGYGTELTAAFADYRLLSGAAPLPPRKAFGVWFSRYHPFSEQAYRDELLPAFRAERVPLDVLMVDTDFKAPHRWNGWDWRADLFPDPRRFFRWAHTEGLAVGLNVHPSIARGDARFAATDAAGGGLSPVVMPNLISVQSDPGGVFDLHHGFNFAEPRQLDAYLALHTAFEEDGADFWWLDWCCEGSTAGTPDGSLSGDAWINSQYTRRTRARGSRWPILSRVGGSWQDWAGDRPGPWGEHRSTIHFTGDARSTWEMLDFQTRFTVAEGNAGLPYVSHDIGGFQGTLDDELYTRWVQSGTFQPILRLHSSNTGDVRRLPWEYAGKARTVAAEFLRLRGELVPYLYTLARETHDSGLPLARGMYLQWPGHEDAYVHDRQYTLGPDLLVAPVAAPGDPATKTVWFPPGDWIDFFTGERHTGPRVETVAVPLERAPVYARAGSIVVRRPHQDSDDQRSLDHLIVAVYPGADARFTLYEDAGSGLDYGVGAFARTTIHWGEGARTLTVDPAVGDFPGRPARRTVEVRVGDREPVTVDCATDAGCAVRV